MNGAGAKQIAPIDGRQTVILVYNVSTPSNPLLVQSYTYDGYLQDARVVKGKLVLITQKSLYNR